MPTILLVNDDADVRSAFAYGLERSGFRVLEAENGQDAVELARIHHPDLVLMDLDMPILDGWAAAERLRGDPATTEIPIIALSGWNLSQEDTDRLAAMFDDFVAIPVELDRLLGLIQAQLDSGSGSNG